MSNESAMQLQSREVQLLSRPQGEPTEENFKLVTTDVAPLGDRQFLVQNIWMSVDPYMRGRMKEGKSYVSPFQLDQPLDGGCLGRVIESRHNEFSVGDFVLANAGWREYWTSNGDGVTKIDPALAPLQAYLGVLGMTGMTAWVGLKRIANLQPGSTVFVSAASGAVGSIVCQIAKLHDCFVIGSAGSKEKLDWLQQSANVDAVINYKEVENLIGELKRLAPNRVDIYFDNVGGDHLEAAIEAMQDFGCVVACGMISTYNATEPMAAPRNLFKIVSKRIRIQGFIVRDHLADRDEFIREMSAWIKSGKIVWNDTVTQGLENAPAAFIGLFSGNNLGKSLVKISEP